MRDCNSRAGGRQGSDRGAVGAVVTELGRLTVRTPAHGAGAVSVTLTNLNGGTVTVANGFTYSESAPEEEGELTLSGVKVLSSLFHPGRDAGLTFTQMPAGTRVRLYSMRGTFVSEFYEAGGRAVWDGRDFDGRDQPSGGYVAILEDRGIERRIRFAIQR